MNGLMLIVPYRKAGRKKVFLVFELNPTVQVCRLNEKRSYPTWKGKGHLLATMQKGVKPWVFFNLSKKNRLDFFSEHTDLSAIDPSIQFLRITPACLLQSSGVLKKDKRPIPERIRDLFKTRKMEIYNRGEYGTQAAAEAALGLSSASSSAASSPSMESESLAALAAVGSSSVVVSADSTPVLDEQEDEQEQELQAEASEDLQEPVAVFSATADEALFLRQLGKGLAHGIVQSDSMGSSDDFCQVPKAEDLERAWKELFPREDLNSAAFPSDSEEGMFTLGLFRARSPAEIDWADEQPLAKRPRLRSQDEE